jgi:hypothetical protein
MWRDSQDRLVCETPIDMCLCEISEKEEDMEPGETRLIYDPETRREDVREKIPALEVNRLDGINGAVAYLYDNGPVVVHAPVWVPIAWTIAIICISVVYLWVK